MLHAREPFADNIPAGIKLHDIDDRCYKNVKVYRSTRLSFSYREDLTRGKMEYGKSSYWLMIKDLQTARCAP